MIRKAKEKDGYIYLMRDGNNRIKIGTAVNIVDRYKNLKISNPTITVYATVFTRKYQEFERFIHQKMAGLNVGGEWFSPEDIAIKVFFELMQKHGEDFDAPIVVFNPSMVVSYE